MTNTITFTVTVTLDPLDGDATIKMVKQAIRQQGWSVEDAIADIISNKLDANKVKGDWDLTVEIKTEKS